MPKTILLVDDSRTIRLLVRAYLVGRDYEFLEVESGILALSSVRTRMPDLVICDVFMAGMSGWDFVRSLRRDPKSDVRAIPVILVSSKQDKDISRRSLEAGANAFLPKPIASERLVATIDDLLATHALRGDAAQRAPRLRAPRGPTPRGSA
jgi:CheY-like chemotaxis protein